MPKRRVYSQTELVEMDLKQLEEVVNREAERINRQISRARRRGEDLEELFTKSEIQRPLRQEKLARMIDRLEAEELEGGEDPKAFLLKQYAAMQETDFTKKGFEARRKEREEYARDLGVDPEDVTAQMIADARRIMRRATGEAGAFYQLLVKAVESGTATNYNFFRTDDKLYLQTLTRRGRQEFIQQQLEKINTHIMEDNKQRDIKGVEKKEQLVTLLQLRKSARNALKTK